MFENRLIREKSPYLLQHAHNPVDWYPWGQEAFDRARREEKPVFLSIGYSTCHWCHVMERESFENEELAELLNKSFVPVKVDREERPDIDAVYMAVCQALTGSAGWPLTVLMTPDQKPFWAGTYLPRQGQYGRPGLTELLKEASSLWRQNRSELRQLGEEIASHIARREEPGGSAPDEALPGRAADLFAGGFDPENGGFGGAPRFPAPHNLLFLMEYGRLKEDSRYSRMAWTTLTQMARGGLFDQIGGGFSRYCTDRAWLIPHFEKMLYDNALLVCAYLEGYASTGRDYYRVTARRTLDYVLRELTGPQGQFYCGQDADSGGREGSYYLLTPEEIRDVLGTEDGGVFCRWYGIGEQGNFEGKNIPNLLHNSEYSHEPKGFASLRASVFRYRQGRFRLHRDDKVLTSWNALMIAALSKAFRILGEGRYLRAAQRAERFLRLHLSENDRPALCWRDGKAAPGGQLDDYAFLAWALLELYQADFDPGHLEWASGLALQMLRLFPDEEKGGFFLTASDAEELIIRPKETYDGAIPSGNSVAGLVLLRLWKLTGKDAWREPAERQLAFLSRASREYPAGHSFAMLALCEASSPSRELVCVSAKGIPEGLQRHSHRLRCQTLLKTPETSSLLQGLAPFTKAYPLPESGYAFYLCENAVCRAPVYSLEELEP